MHCRVGNSLCCGCSHTIAEWHMCGSASPRHAINSIVPETGATATTCSQTNRPGKAIAARSRRTLACVIAAVLVPPASATGIYTAAADTPRPNTVPETGATAATCSQAGCPGKATVASHLHTCWPAQQQQCWCCLHLLDNKASAGQQSAVLVTQFATVPSTWKNDAIEFIPNHTSVCGSCSHNSTHSRMSVHRTTAASVPPFPPALCIYA